MSVFTSSDKNTLFLLSQSIEENGIIAYIL